MSNKKVTEIRNMADAELAEELASLREEFFLRRFTSDPKRIQNPGKFREMKRRIARILTVQRERAAAANTK